MNAVQSGLEGVVACATEITEPGREGGARVDVQSALAMLGPEWGSAC